MVNVQIISLSLSLSPVMLQMFEWDNDNVIITGSSDGVVRVDTIQQLTNLIHYTDLANGI